MSPTTQETKHLLSTLRKLSAIGQLAVRQYADYLLSREESPNHE